MDGMANVKLNILGGYVRSMRRELFQLRDEVNTVGDRQGKRGEGVIG
jgi:hypothetical protein